MNKMVRINYLLVVFISSFFITSSLIASSDKCFFSFKTLLFKELADKSWAYEGKFGMASSTDQDLVLKSFKEANGNFAREIPDGNIARVTDKNLVKNFSEMNNFELEKLTKLAIKRIKDLYVTTSAAGVASRLGGAIKALIPYNLVDSVGKNNFKTLSAAGKVVKAKTNFEAIQIAQNNFEISNLIDQKTNKLIKDILSKSKDGSELKYKKDIEFLGDKVAELAKQEIRKIMKGVEYNPQAMTPLDMKFVNVAYYSKMGDTYVPFDIWTSKQTHGDIKEYVKWFKQNYNNKKFHPDPVVDQEIKNNLKAYFKKAGSHGDTHLFGYQEGYHAINVNRKVYDTNSMPIGAGPGDLEDYLERSGRLSEIQKMGKKDMVFENIEVVSDMLLIYGGHILGGKMNTVVLVPEMPGYSGGSPFMVKTLNGEWNLELVEGPAVPDEFKKGNKYFNTNTIISYLDILRARDVDFELKERNTIARLKKSRGLITYENETTAIAGRVGKGNSMVEYENYKSWDEYGEHGNWYLEIWQNRWGSYSGRNPASLKKGVK